MSTRSLLLLGRHHTELGPLAVAELPDGGAIALSRGALRKAYRHVDPNEDTVLLMRTQHGTLLAVADGYNGTAASELAIESVALAGPELIQTPTPRFFGRMEQLVIDISRGLVSLEPSRSCLLVCSITADQFRWICLGDSMLFRSSSSDPASAPNDLVLEPRLRGLPSARDFWSGAQALEPGERIAVVTDGVTNFIAEQPLIAQILDRAEHDPEAARTIALAAMRGGAGDNIAVATIRAG